MHCVFLLAGISRMAAAYDLEMGVATVLDSYAGAGWTTITFQQPFDTVPHVYVLPTDEGPDPATLRIRSVSTTGFQVTATEPSAEDGPHIAMNTAYLAIEPGTHLLPGGARIISFEHSTTTFATRVISQNWDSVAFPAAFTGTPAVLGSIQTVVNETGAPPTTPSVPFMDVGIRNVNSTGLQVTLERAESAAGVVVLPERIAILAIDDGTNETFVDVNSNLVQLQALVTPRNVRGWDDGCYSNSYPVPFAAAPLAVASLNTRTGNNGGWVRRCGNSASALSLTVDEDADFDSERGHQPEEAGIVAASIAFHADIDANLLITKSVEVLSDPVNGVINPKAIPTSTVGYTIEVENTGTLPTDDGSLVVRDEVPASISLCVTAACFAGGPVIFDDSASPVATGVSLGSVEYSNDGGASFVYSPTPDAFGFDSAVNAVRITMSGTFAGVAIGGAPRFELRLAARVN